MGRTLIVVVVLCAVASVGAGSASAAKSPCPTGYAAALRQDSFSATCVNRLETRWQDCTNAALQRYINGGARITPNDCFWKRKVYTMALIYAAMPRIAKRNKMIDFSDSLGRLCRIALVGVSLCRERDIIETEIRKLQR